MANYRLVESTLDNGLTVFVVHDPSATLVSARTYVRAGAISEGECLGQGLSHFLEHLTAGGPTRQRSESEYKRLLSLLGGNYNAYTTTDHTCYYINTIPEKAETAVEILSEWMFDNQFTLTEFDREREVITREIEKNNAELGRVFYQLCQSHYYQTHPMRYPVIGYLENFRKTTFEQLKSYYNRYYVASNMILVVGGPMDPDQVMPWIRHHFGRAPSVAPPIHLFTEEPRPFAGRELEKEWETSTAYLSLRFSTIDLFSDDLYALDLLDFMLTNGDESIMYRDIVEDQQLAYSISSSSYSPSVTTGYFDFTLELDPPHLEAAKARVLHHLANIRDGKISADRVDRAKKQKLSEDVFSITTIEDTTSRIGQGYLYAQTPHFYDHYVANFKSVTVDDVVRVARRYFDPDRMIVSLLSPRKTTEATPGVTVYTPSGRQIPQLHRLKNGVRVLLFTESSYPRVYARTYMVGGVRAETAETNGLGYVMADLLATGTDDMSKADISRMIEDRGADISGGIGNNTIFHTMECLSEDFKTLFPLYAKTLLRARFDPSELAETQRQVLKYISQRKDDWYRYALYQFKQSFFMGNPYGFATSGEADVIRRITPEVLDNYKAQHLDPEKMVVALFGDIDADAALAMAEQEFGGIQPPVGSLQISPIRLMHKAPAMHHLTIEQDVAAVFTAFDGERFEKSADATRLDLVNTVLTGMNYPSGRLFHLLRDEGLVYLVHGVNFLGIEPGYFLIYALTSDPHQQRVQEIVASQIQSVSQTTISTEEFDQAIAQMRFHFKDRLASLESLATTAAIDELFDRGFDHYLKRESEIDHLNIKDVLEYAQRYLVNPQTYWFNKRR